MPVAPSGWPSAMAPPLTLTGPGRPRSACAQFRTTAAKASFTSYTVAHRELHPGPVQEPRGGRHGPVEQVVGVGAGDHLVRQQRARGRSPSCAGPLRGHPQDGGGAVGDLRRGARRCACPPSTFGRRAASPSMVVGRRPSSPSRSPRGRVAECSGGGVGGSGASDDLGREAALLPGAAARCCDSTPKASSVGAGEAFVVPAIRSAPPNWALGGSSHG